jgi:membrane protease YdiL (CAAX protease family)
MIKNSLAHALFLFLLLGPWLNLPVFQRHAVRIRGGIPNARLHLYWQTIAKQIVVVALLLLLHEAGGVSAASLGWVAPQSWPKTLAIGLGVVAAALYFSLRIEPKVGAAALAKIKSSTMGVMIPESNRERRWFGCLSIGAGIMEEMLCRGFLFYYLANYLGIANPVLTIIASSALFGLAHIYQGWKKAAGPAAAGVVLGSLYVYTGSLVLPIIVHAIVDYRVLWAFPKAKAPPPEERARHDGNSGLGAKSG